VGTKARGIPPGSRRGKGGEKVQKGVQEKEKAHGKKIRSEKGCNTVEGEKKFGARKVKKKIVAEGNSKNGPPEKSEGPKRR